MSNPCISSSKVAGTAVYNANGDKLGSIDDLLGVERHTTCCAARRRVAGPRSDAPGGQRTQVRLPATVGAAERERRARTRGGAGATRLLRRRVALTKLA